MEATTSPDSTPGRTGRNKYKYAHAIRRGESVPTDASRRTTASIRTWMRTSQRLGLLAGLGDGSIPYTHEALDALPAGRAADHLRGILVTAGVLPPEHRTAERLQAGLATRLADLDDGPDKDLVRQFARWHHLRLIRCHSTDRDASLGSYVSGVEQQPNAEWH